MDALWIDPTRVKPTTEAADPIREKLRTDMELPNCKKSITDAEELKRLMPMTDAADPHRAMLRTDSELPTCTKLHTETADPQRA